MNRILPNLLSIGAFLMASVLSFAQIAEPCVAGFAGVYPCSNYDLVSQLSIAQLGGAGSANDIWGWTDPLDGKEYAIVGLSDGTSFVDISNPGSPVVLGVLPTQTFNSSWHDVKVYNNHAFIVSEASNHGMQVFDLTRLRTVTSPPETFTVDAHYSGFGNAHNIVINEASGYAYGVGTGTYSGGLHIINIQNPTTPTLAGSFSDDGYTHDAQVVNYVGPDTDYAGAEIVFASNEDTFTIIDVTDKTDPTQISRNAYAGSSYTHQGWATEDHRYYLMNDELDEQNTGNNTRTFIWDIQNLDSPILIGYYESANSSIDHNLYIKGDEVFESNYRSGLRVLDISDIANGNLVETGYFDVYPNNDNAGFNGTWSNYPYFASENIIISSIEGGLFIVKASTPQACPAPSNILASNVTSTSADITWTDNASGISNGFNVEVVPSGTTPTGSGVFVNGTNYSFSGGTVSTDYDVYVQADCNPIDYSFWVGPMTFSTLADYCAGSPFVDSGDDSANYSNNENEIYVICPDEAGGSVALNFSIFNVEGRSTTECWDDFFVYDGNSTAGTPITPASLGLGTSTEGFCNTAGTLLGETITSNNPSGCLTINFVTDGSVTYDGWVASVTCLPAPGPDCSVFDTAPVELTKSQQPVPFPNGNIDRVQVKWYKSAGAVKYSAADSSAVDVQFWAIRDLASNTPITGADSSLISKKTKPGQDFFKWPVKFIRADVEPNTRYRWRVRTYCQEGEGQVSPWSETKIFNTPNFDPLTGIYTEESIAAENEARLFHELNSASISLYPNPNDGQGFLLQFSEEMKNAVVRVYNVNGQLMHQESLGRISEGSTQRLSLEAFLSAGLYTVVVQSESHIERHSMICQ